MLHSQVMLGHNHGAVVHLPLHNHAALKMTEGKNRFKACPAAKVSLLFDPQTIWALRCGFFWARTANHAEAWEPHVHVILAFMAPG